MGSLFTTSKDSKIKTTFGKGKFIPFYLQLYQVYVWRQLQVKIN